MFVGKYMHDIKDAVKMLARIVETQYDIKSILKVG